jgi:glutamine amidotransferase
MIAVVDYGVGNLRSVAKAFEAVGVDVTVTKDPVDLEGADRIVLPGVGAFYACMRSLEQSGLIDTLAEQVLVRRKPFLGICVGMQLLADEGYEKGVHRGLGWVSGKVVPFDRGPTLKVPHIGWNDVFVNDGASVLHHRGGESVYYFVHSYVFEPSDPQSIAAVSVYGGSFVSAIKKDNILGVQFHPEKSQAAGLSVIENFATWSP